MATALYHKGVGQISDLYICHLLLEALEHLDHLGTKEQIKTNIAQGMQCIKGKAGRISNKDGFPGEWFDEKNDKKDVHQPAKEVSPGNAERYHHSTACLWANFTEQSGAGAD